MKDLVVKENWIPLEDFFSAYKDCRRRKRTTMNALKFEVNYEDNLVQLWKDVNHTFILFGRDTCSSQNPKCDNCPLKKYCKHKKRR